MDMNKEKFMKNTKPGPNGCIEWTRGLNWNGYGLIYINGVTKKAHRTSFQLYNGEIPKGLYILHKCDNRKCVNPDHLYAGTHRDNINDMIRKGRNSRGPNMEQLHLQRIGRVEKNTHKSN